MRNMTGPARQVSFTLVMLATLAGVAQVQRQNQRNVPPQNPAAQTAPGFPDSPDHIGLPNNVAEKQAKIRNDDRQKRLVADSDKLLELATQLRNDVAKTDRNILSIDVVHRAEEIERLAKSVKDRMKG